jgi:hypothetical protein
MDPNTSLFQLNLDAQNSYTLRSAASWARVLGIVGLIMGVLCIILGVMVQQAVSSYDGYYRNTNGFSMRTMGMGGLIIYVIMGLIMIISSIFALNAGSKISGGLRANDQATLNAGFANIRNYFAFWAVMMILSLLLMILGIAGTAMNS